ncbi:glycoside hydrolase family 31 protein [Mucilaginibacter sabulilitoris]|uniref:Glycoside hydrolase family 31 protein n=1 Tax=Mucilaginibacter sabulilitoris TaxID=1173583 RepID=A0ABZ0TQY6_9SPHI|nr:glycoside hydrolase family 31 protein [Mucilaginibacter sabulilitoris]WPU95548.1 glycoside hydrolase family 31 protein [Mucilaginibacter sabulilitoris]
MSKLLNAVMNKVKMIICPLVLSLLISSFCYGDEGILYIKKHHYTLIIRKNKFAYAFKDSTGKMVADFSPESGVNFSRSGNSLLSSCVFEKTIVLNDTLFSCILHNSNGLKARASFRFFDDVINLKIAIDDTEAENKEKDMQSKPAGNYTIEACIAGIGPAYGLGDHGSYGEGINVFGYSNNNFLNLSDGTRFVSTFAIFPKQQFAQVLFDNGSKRVAINKRGTRLGANKVKAISIYYFFGTPQKIYSNYASVKKKVGYPDAKPKFDFFDLGYEAFGSLGWNAAQATVQSDVQMYLDKGYPLKWVVVGSGFWKGDRSLATEGATTSFGIWDNSLQPGRKDKLANPRYPDVAAFKKYFSDRNLHLILGLRVNFKALPEKGGFYDPANDGEYSREGAQRGFFLKDINNNPALFSAVFPKGPTYVLDADNVSALQWFYAGVKKWGVQGYKEDTMLKDGEKLNNDAKCNKVNEFLMQKGYYVMVRNSAYSVPGDILRVEDTEYGHGQDRPVINVLNDAASGTPNTYPDIVGGKYLKPPLKDDQKRYFLKNAFFAAVCPAMSMGLGPWHIENPAYENAIKKAAMWHHEFAPYLYSAAVESYYTGFPTTMTPLPIAFPNDSNTYNIANKTKRQYCWMLGPSLLATPIYGDDYATASTRNVYLPKGKWIDYESGRCFMGPTVLNNYKFPDGKIPAFIGGKGVLVKKSEESDTFIATVYPISKEQSSYRFYYPDGKSSSIITIMNVNWERLNIQVTDINSKKKIDAMFSKRFQSYSFPLVKGHNYTVKSDI